MPVKHQTDSYRVINGEKYINMADTWKGCEYLDTNTKYVKEYYKSKGCKVRVQKVDTFYRIFVRELDLIRKGLV